MDFEPQSLVLRFTGIETLPPGIARDDCFRLTSQGEQTKGVSVAGKSLLTYLGFRPNGHAQGLEIVELNPAEHHITLRLPRGEVHNE